MNNIIQSDLYRIRKGVAMRNTLIAVLALTVFAAIVLKMMGGGVFQGIIENELVNGVLSEGERMGLEGDIADMNEIMTMIPQDGAGFAKEMLNTDMLSMLVLVIAVAVMGADFGAGTFRNTLSFETDRGKVYLGKMAVNFLLLLVLMLANLVFSVVVGGLFFGLGGFMDGFFATRLIEMVLQLPILMALLGFAQCLLAFTKKSGATIAAYLLFVLFYSSVIQFIAMLLPTMRWILRLDFISAMRLMAPYQNAPIADVAVPLILAACVFVGTTVLGMLHYSKADMH